MEENNDKGYTVHVHFNSEPSPEFMEAFEKMCDLAYGHIKEIKNERLLAEEFKCTICYDTGKIIRYNTFGGVVGEDSCECTFK